MLVAEKERELGRKLDDPSAVNTNGRELRELLLAHPPPRGLPRHAEWD